jgi:hypothetical protein
MNISSLLICEVIPVNNTFNACISLLMETVRKKVAVSSLMSVLFCSLWYSDNKAGSRVHSFLLEFLVCIVGNFMATTMITNLKFTVLRDLLNRCLDFLKHT